MSYKQQHVPNMAARIKRAIELADKARLTQSAEKLRILQKQFEAWKIDQKYPTHTVWMHRRIGESIETFEKEHRMITEVLNNADQMYETPPKIDVPGLCLDQQGRVMGIVMCRMQLNKHAFIPAVRLNENKEFEPIILEKSGWVMACKALRRNNLAKMFSALAWLSWAHGVIFGMISMPYLLISCCSAAICCIVSRIIKAVTPKIEEKYLKIAKEAILVEKMRETLENVRNEIIGMLNDITKIIEQGNIAGANTQPTP